MSTKTSESPAKAPVREAIPFLDLVTQHLELEGELLTVFRSALRAAAFVGGAEVAAFESEFAAFCTTSDAVGLGSGTDALRFAYLAVGVESGDEVITVPNTFIATTESISQAGASIKFVDVSEGTFTMDPSALESAITPRTVGIVPVHLYGQVADMDPIMRVAERHGLWVIEDAAQAHGARYRDKQAGSIGVLGAFSFYPGKNLGACGEAGAVVGSDRAFLDRVRKLREHGQAKKYFHDMEGYNGRLDAIQASFLRVKLRHLRDWNEARRRAAFWYREALADVHEIELPVEAAYSHPVYHLFVVQAERRDQLQAHLTARQIGTGLHYPLPLHLQKAYQHLGQRAGAFPVAERAAERLLSLPMYPNLSEGEVARVADAIRSFYK